MKLSTCALAVFGAALPLLSTAEVERQHGAHEHGAATLMVSAEGHELTIMLDSPAYNILGFEHSPSTEEQHAALTAAVAKLERGASLFNMDRAAGCEFEDGHVTTPWQEDNGHEAEEHGHAEDDHGHEDEHDHDHEDEHESAHTDILTEWHFHCDDLSKLSEIEVELFGAFSNLEDLDAQYLLEDNQGAAELSPKETTLTF